MTTKLNRIYDAITLAEELGAPNEVLDFFLTAAFDLEAEETYDEHGVNTRNSFNTAN